MYLGQDIPFDYRKHGNLDTCFGTGTPSREVQDSIYAGIYARQSSARIICPSGYCTFQKYYHTLGYCARCDDITSQIIYNSTKEVKDANGRITDGIWTLSLPSGSRLTSSRDMGHTFVQSTISGSSCDIFWQSKRNCTEAQRAAISSTHGPCPTYDALNCSVYQCIRTYHAEVKNGSISETLLRTAEYYNKETYMETMSMVDTSCVSNDQRKSLITNDEVNSTAEFVKYDGNGLPSMCVYHVSREIRSSVSSWLKTYVFEGSVSSQTSYFFTSQPTGPVAQTRMFNHGEIVL